MIPDCVTMEYEAAAESTSPKKSLKSINIILLVIKVLWFSSIEFFKCVINFFIPPQPSSLQGQLALITGGANGLGKALSKRLAKEKCDIAIVDVDIKNAKKTANEISEEFHVDCRAFQCDVSDVLQVSKLKNKVEMEMRSVDVLVNNAGIIFLMDFESCDVKVIKKVIDVNLTGQILLTKAFLPTMISKGYGRVVSICSAVALTSSPFSSVYTASKYGIDGFMNALYDEMCALELEDKIILTTVYPDVTRTQKEFVSIMDRAEMLYDMLLPKRVADETIEAVMRNKRREIISDFEFGHVMTNKFPDRVRKYLKGSLIDFKEFSQK